MGESRESTGSDVCGACHGTGSALAGGDIAGAILGTPHTGVVPSDSGADIGCRGCHAPHASANASLVRSTLRSSLGVTVSVSGEPGLCLACHEGGSGTYGGGTVAAAQKHTTVAVSDRALTAWPGASGDPGGCDGCHEPHGKGDGPRYTRASGDAMCETCHADASVSYPAGYSYRGADTFSLSGHDGLSAPALRYLTLTAEGPDFAAWEGTEPPTPSDPGTVVTAERVSFLTTADGQRLMTDLQRTDGAFDYQLYRFEVQAETSTVLSARVHWEGFGEEAPNFPVVLSVWVPASSNWELLHSAQMVSQTTVNLPLRPADHIAGDGFVYIMAKARYSHDEKLVSGPTITTLSSTSVRVDWVTSGLTDSWVDYGSSSAYGSTKGSATRTQNHSVTVSGLSPGVWHFRVRSMALDGGSYVSGDMTRGIPKPTVTAEPDYAWSGVDPTVTLQWAAPALAPGGPFEFRMYLLKDGASYVTTGWATDTSYTSVLGLGTYTWRVEARDAAGYWYDYSAWDTFYVWDSTGSCPFLFTWDGTGYAFEADLYGPGKLGLKTKSGFARPTPDDVYILAHEPAAKDGVLDLRLVEERFETDYLDQLTLYTIDAPADRDVYAQKREAGGASFLGVDSVLHTVSKAMSAPVSAVHLESGEDVGTLIAAADGSYLVLSEDRNADFDYQTIELDLGDVGDAPQVKIVMDAVSMYPSTLEGAERAATFDPRTKLEVQDSSGQWVAVPAGSGALPKAPEFSRPYAFDISNIWVSDSRKVRFTFLFKTYVDWIAVDTTADVPVTISEVPLLSTDLSVRGFSAKSSEDEIYEYVYSENTGRTAYLPGNYTRLGEVTELLRETDDRFVIYGGGDEVALSFQPPEPAGEGVTRRFAVHTNGYYKDLKSDVEHSVAPLPFAAMSNFPYGEDEHYPDDEFHASYLEQWNTRAEGEVEQPQVEALDSEAMGLWDRAASLVSSVWRAISGLFAAGDQAATVAQPPQDSSETDALHRSLNTDVVALELTLSADAPSGTCVACHAPHGALESGRVLPGLRAASDGRTCTGAGGGGCHSDAANSAGGIDIYDAFTAGPNARARHDSMQVDQISSKGRTACADCHNPHRDNTSSRYSDPDDLAVGMGSPLASAIASNGSVYVLVGADHDGTGPTISNIAVSVTLATKTSPTISWTTNEKATSWIDWGLTTSYELGNETTGTPFGNSTLVTAHSVQMSNLATGTVYHYRVRSADALGNSSVSGDRTYKVVDAPPAPVMADVTTQTGPGAGPILVPVSSSSVAAPDGNPVEYQFQIVGVTTGLWRSTPSDSFWLYDGTYQVRVRARDSVYTYAVSDWSATDSFIVENAPDSGSCPFLFTWNGSEYVFEADLFGSGKLGTRTKSGTLKPSPEDPYLLETTPAIKDGFYEFRLVEERYEVDYLDQMKLLTLDVPTGYGVYAEKFQAGGSAFPGIEGALHTVKLPVGRPLRATHVQTGDDVTALVAERDENRLILNEDRNVDFEYQTIELDLGDAASASTLKLVMDAISMFPTTDEGAQHAATFGPRTKLEVQDADGAWIEVPADKATLPKPPEFIRPYAFDISDIWLSESRSVRITFLFKTYVDWIGVDTSEDVPVSIAEVPLTSADLRMRGFDPKSEPGEIYEYVYGEPSGKAAYFDGAYTKFGDVTPLLKAVDDMFVIFGGGDELALRFDASRESPVPSGALRTYLFYTHGYYKDAKVGLDETVEPLPFAEMSNYPYPDDEHYPDDEAHDTYRATWNTRAESSVRSSTNAIIESLGGATSTGLRDWRSYHMDAWTAEVVTGEDSFSVDSDQMLLRVQAKDGTLTTATPAAGWESASADTAKPTPLAPGASVDATTLAAIALNDGTYWRTSLSSTDRVWNWQIVEYELGAAAIDDTKSLTLSWTGHGEPTAGYNTAVYLWNPSTSSWTLIKSAVMASKTTVGTAVDSVSEQFCLRCHDGTAPTGVVFPAGVTTIASKWTVSTGDFHGAGSGSGVGSTGLKPPYSRGQAPIPCSTCHDVHGSASLLHVPDTVNGYAVPPIQTGSDLAELCRACHIGTSYEWHDDGYNRCWCHYVHKYEPYGHDEAFVLHDGIDCLMCHQHGTGWVHPPQYCQDCHNNPSGTRAF